MFTDTKTGDLLDVFHNQFTDETVKLKHFATRRGLWYHLSMRDKDCVFGDQYFNYQVLLGEDSFWFRDKIGSLETGVPATHLQSVVGNQYVLEDDKKNGTLEVNVFKCLDAAGPEYTFAMAGILVDGAQAPVQVSTGMESHWVSYALHIDEPSNRLSRLIGDSGFKVVPGLSELSFSAQDGLFTSCARLLFAQGEIQLSIVGQCRLAPFERHRVFAGINPAHYSLMFGTEWASRCDGGIPSVQLSGVTPLSDLGLAVAPARAYRVSNLVWDYRILAAAQRYE